MSTEKLSQSKGFVNISVSKFDEGVKIWSAWRVLWICQLYLALVSEKMLKRKNCKFLKHGVDKQAHFKMS